MKVPKPRKLKSGTWFIQLRLNGESISVTAPTQNECIKKAEYIKAEYRNGLKSYNRNEITLYEAIDRYIESRNKILSPSTINGYRIIQRNRFKSVSNTPLSRIDNWQNLINIEAEFCNPKTIKNAFGFIVSVLKDNDVLPPKVTLPRIMKRERNFLDPDEIKILMSAVRDTEVEMAVLLGLHSLRRSEMLALTKSKARNGQIKIDCSVVPNEHNVLVEKPYPKTAKSNRIINIQIERLNELISASPSEKLIAMNPNTLKDRINKVCHENQLPEIGLHGLRHSFCSLCFYLGVSESVTMAIGGWEDFQTVHKVYKHLSEKEMISSESKIGAFFKD